MGYFRGPATLTIEPERQTVAQGTVAKITCLVGDDPNARVTWRKANENLPSYSEVGYLFCNIWFKVNMTLLYV